jgi:VanZ family protein
VAVRAARRIAVVDRVLWVAALAVAGATIVWTLGPEPPDAGAIPSVDKLFHATAYVATVFLLLLAADWRPGRGSGRFPGTAVWICVVAVVAGGALELVQHVTGRDAELLDWVADAVGVAVAFGVWVWIRRRRDPARRPA